VRSVMSGTAARPRRRRRVRREVQCPCHVVRSDGVRRRSRGLERRGLPPIRAAKRGVSAGPTTGASFASWTRRRVRRCRPTRSASSRCEPPSSTAPRGSAPPIARLDRDGFLWVVGRADQTILRGGFKIQPDVVRTALERHRSSRRSGRRNRRRATRTGARSRRRAAARFADQSAELLEHARAPRRLRAARGDHHRRHAAAHALREGRAPA
jgi:hypothetical protein